jgi:hypothetical protein
MMMRELMLERFRSDEVAAIFHEDNGEGYFFLYDSADKKVLRQVQLYTAPTAPQIREEDVDILWSRNEEKAGLAIWGRMRAILDIDGKNEQVCSLETPDSPIIEIPAMTFFPEYLDRKAFLAARKRYWKAALIQAHPDLRISDQPTSLLQTRFLVAALDSSAERAAVFEDDGETGYLYVYFFRADAVQTHVHVYDHTEALQITKDSVDVLWSTDESKCAVRIWGQLRAIIDFKMGKEGRAWLENRDTPGIKDPEWLRGFELM